MYVGKLEWKLGSGRVFGLDISHQKMAVTVLNPNHDVDQYEVALNEEGLRLFLKGLRSDDRVALEATSNTWYLYSKIKPLVQEVVVADAGKVKLIANSKAKTDRNDSNVLAILYTLGLLPTVWMPDPETQGDREVLHCRCALLGKLTRVKNQVRALLAQHGLSFDASDVTAKDGDLFIIRMGSRLPASAQMCLASLLRELRFLENELQVVSAQVLVRSERWQSSIELLLTIPGVGLLTAFTILAVVGTIERFPAAESLGNYTGAVPMLRASANKSWSGGITKAGPRMLRWALTEAVLSLIRSNGYFRNLYRRIKRGRKNRHGIAVMACVRQLAETIWHMLTSKRGFHHGVPQPQQEVPQRRKQQREKQKFQAARKIAEKQPHPMDIIRDNTALLMELSRKAESSLPVPAELRPSEAPRLVNAAA